MGTFGSKAAFGAFLVLNPQLTKNFNEEVATFTIACNNFKTISNSEIKRAAFRERLVTVPPRKAEKGLDLLS